MKEFTMNYPMIERGNHVKESCLFTIVLNSQRITTQKLKLIIFCRKIYEKYLINLSDDTIEIYINFLCNDTGNIFARFIEEGILNFPIDRNHYRDLFEIGRYLGIDIIIDVFREYTKTFKEINLENFHDVLELAEFDNNMEKINECITFIASNMYKLGEDFILSTLFSNGYDFSERVFTSSSLRTKSDDSMCNIILNLSAKNSSFILLLNYAKVENCSANILNRMYNFSVENNLESITNKVFFTALSRKSSTSNSPVKSNISESNNSRNFKRTENKPSQPSFKKYSTEIIHYQGTIQDKKLDSDSIIEHAEIKTNDKLSEKIDNIDTQTESTDNQTANPTTDEITHDDETYQKLENLAKRNNINAIKSLVNHDKEFIHKDIVLTAAKKGNLNLISQLRKINPQFLLRRDQDENTIAHIFAMNGNLQGFKMVFNLFDVNDTNKHQWTFLHFAAYYKQPNICALLLADDSIEKNLLNEDGNTPLDLANQKNNESIIKILKENNCK
ncbi:hypothetical protein TVAG_227570 [Trichomonas vaginalis G3]|uniref:Uncharacterized protein n=1 Tax=Trichomonas vaginalis (strain ATCC PRA-98 / G3) TaxID=412133 RepID=A2ERQ9_TRIV3|nr:proteasome regulatory particle assembly [Trichomonas vaginalis G3]EAY04640.1 hypothetical protein TVAG_227570 [Trichomonas vaginalis G3]KAI5549415.1 proteasome regulatory particle assembly [Trichomonas vaginalis G3]|eukprot:XP_001316863.1 hypothetical protein [Trichomonas vaginalis G3]